MPAAMEKLPDQDYYKTLGVPKNASQSDINKAYKKLAVKYHPDKNPDSKEIAEENFKKVSEAYEVLSNEEKRKTYDTCGKEGLKNQGMGGGGFSQSQAQEIFAQFFGGEDPFSVLFGKDGRGGGMGGGSMPGGMHFQFQQMGGMPGGMGGGMGGMPAGMEAFAGLMGGMPGGMGMMGGMPGGMGMMGGMPGGMGGRQARQQHKDKPDVLPPATEVIVRGLQGAAQHNNKNGRVESFDGQRYTVAIQGGDVLRIKHENLLQRVDVEVAGMQSRAELNGKHGSVIGFDETKERYHVQISGQSPMGMQGTNLIFPPTTRVRVQGLKSGAQWNEKIGKVLEFDRASWRYLVQMTEQDQLRIKPENIRL